MDSSNVSDMETTSASASATEVSRPVTGLPFPPITSSHILHCSYHSWYPRLRSVVPKSRLIPLSTPFLDYLRADGIILPPENPPNDIDSGYSDSETEDDPSEAWADIHEQIRSTIRELGGKVVPKLNWSAPKDATWMSPTNDMECRTPNEVYLLLKSSDFITHDLEHAFDGCDGTTTTDSAEVLLPLPYHLVLRKAFNLNPALEFRCFVRNARLIAVSQREMTFFPFLFELRSSFRRRIQEFLETHLRPPNKFPDPNFVFDVYIPPPHDRVWLIDINPWAPRTDPLLFSWLELLQLPEEEEEEDDLEDGDDSEDGDGESDQSEREPEFRLVQRDDPEAYQFSATKYSAHKLPREVVDASMTPSGMKEMMEEWQRVMNREDNDDDDEDEED